MVVGPADARHPGGLPRRRAAATGAAPAALRPRLPPRRRSTRCSTRPWSCRSWSRSRCRSPRSARRDLPWIVVPRLGSVPRWAVIALIFVAMDGCNWLAHLANHRVRDALALPRAAPLPRGHERAHGLSDPSADPRVVPRRADPGDRAARQRRRADDAARRLRGRRGVRALEHQPRLRSAGADLRQPQLPPHPPPARSAPRTSTSASRSRSGTRSSIGRCSRPRPRSAPTPGCPVGRSSSSRPATDRTTSPLCSASCGGPFRPLDRRADDVAGVVIAPTPWNEPSGAAAGRCSRATFSTEPSALRHRHRRGLPLRDRRSSGSSSTTGRASSSAGSTVRASTRRRCSWRRHRHLHPGGLLAVVGGDHRVRWCPGARARPRVTRLAGLALFGDQVDRHDHRDVGQRLSTRRRRRATSSTWRSGCWPS